MGRIRQTKAWYQGAGRVGVGGRRGLDPGRRRCGTREQAESELGADVGRSQADEDGEGNPGRMKTVAGEGTGTQTEAGQM